jgi:hypothetical protein
VGGVFCRGRVAKYDERTKNCAIEYCVDGGEIFVREESLDFVLNHLASDDPGDDGDDDSEDEYPFFVGTDASSLPPHDMRMLDSPEEVTEENVDEGSAENEQGDANDLQEGPAGQRAAYPQLGTAGHLGNAQTKPFFRVKINRDFNGARVHPVHTDRLTRIAQMYMPFTRFFFNKTTEQGFFNSLWRVRMLCLQCLSPFHTAIFSNLPDDPRTKKKRRVDPVTELTQLLTQLVKSLEDYHESIVTQDLIYSRWEVTIEIDLSASNEVVPTLPILPGTCPLDALVVVDAASFRASFSNLLSLMITPLSTMALSESSFDDVRAMTSPNAKAAIICVIEMAVNTLGGGGVGKNSILGLLLKKHTRGIYDSRFLAPLSSDLTTISRQDHLVTGLFFGLSPEYLGFQCEHDEATDSTSVTISKTLEFQVSKTLRCPKLFLDCLQRIFGQMVSAGPHVVEHSLQTVSFLQEVEFPRIQQYNAVQVQQLFKSIAGFLLKLYRNEWADIIASKCENFPFQITAADEQDYTVSSPSDLKPHLIGIRCDRTLTSVWSSIRPNLKAGPDQQPKPVKDVCESLFLPALNR